MKAKAYPILLAVVIHSWLPTRPPEDRSGGNGTEGCPGGPMASVFSSTPSNCANNSGRIDLEVIGGTAPFTYDWGPGLPATEDLEGLASGNYQVTVTDVNGCADTVAVTIQGQVQVSLSAVTVPVSSCSTPNGSIFLLVTHGTPPFIFNWSTGASQEDIGGLTPGVYTVSVTDHEQCSAIGMYTVGSNQSDAIFSSITRNLCPGDSLWFNGIFYKTPGIYQHTLHSWLGCDSTVELTLLPSESGEFDALPDSFFIENNAAKISLNVLSNDHLSGSDFTLSIVEPAQAGYIQILTNTPEYTLIQPDFIGADSFRYALCPTDCHIHCDTGTAVIIVFEEIAASFNRAVKNVLTPGTQDGLNDLFEPLETLKFLGFEPDARKSSLDIYNRWGDLLLRRTGADISWDGRSGGKPVPQGAYYYILRTELAGRPPIELAGAISVLRSRNE